MWEHLSDPGWPRFLEHTHKIIKEKNWWIDLHEKCLNVFWKSPLQRSKGKPWIGKMEFTRACIQNTQRSAVAQWKDNPVRQAHCLSRHFTGEGVWPAHKHRTGPPHQQSLGRGRWAPQHPAERLTPRGQCPVGDREQSSQDCRPDVNSATASETVSWFPKKLNTHPPCVTQRFHS